MKGKNYTDWNIRLIPLHTQKNFDPSHWKLLNTGNFVSHFVCKKGTMLLLMRFLISNHANSVSEPTRFLDIAFYV